MKRTKLAALLGAGLLTFGVTGMALATTGTDLLAGQVGNALSDFTNNCDFGDAQDGMVGIQFNLTQADASDGSLTYSFNSGAITGTKAHVDKADGGTIKWYVWITADTSATIDSAHTDVTGKNLVISHICAGAGESSAPSAPASAPASTDTPVPSQGGGGDTNQPSQPSTDSAFGTGSSGPSDTAWLLVVALGVLLASVVVLTPARAKNRR